MNGDEGYVWVRVGAASQANRPCGVSLAGRWRLKRQADWVRAVMIQASQRNTRQSARGEKMFVFWCVHSVMPRVLQLQGGSLGTRSRTAWVDGDDDGLQGAGLVRRGHIDMRGFLLE
jgi:hypothetical protein